MSSVLSNPQLQQPSLFSCRTQRCRRRRRRSGLKRKLVGWWRSQKRKREKKSRTTKDLITVPVIVVPVWVRVWVVVVGLLEEIWVKKLSMCHYRACRKFTNSNCPRRLWMSFLINEESPCVSLRSSLNMMRISSSNMNCSFMIICNRFYPAFLYLLDYHHQAYQKK